MHRHAGPVAQCKQKGGRWRHFDLLVIARGFQFPATRQQCVIQFGGALDGRAVDRSGDAMEFGVRSVEHDHAPLGEETRKQARKCAAEVLSRTVRLAQEFCGFRIAQQSGSRFDDRLDLRPEPHRSHGSIGQASSRSGEFLQRTIRPEKRNVIDLIQVVVGGGQPEYGNAAGAGAGGFTGQFDRTQRLEDGKQRAAEKSDLLSRDQGGRAGAQAVNIFQSLGRRVPCPVLPFQDVRHPGPPRRVVAQLSGFVHVPLRKIRRAGIERLDGGRPGKEIAEKPGGVRNLAEWQTLRLHRHLS